MPDGYAPQTLALDRLRRAHGGPRREPHGLQQRPGAAVERDHLQQQPVRRELERARSRLAHVRDRQPVNRRRRDRPDRPGERRDLRRGREHRARHDHPDEPQPRLGDLRLHVQLQRLQHAGRGEGHGGRAREGHAGRPPGLLQRDDPVRQEVPGVRRGRAEGARARDRDARRRLPRVANLAAAKRDWLTAHLQYQTLGAAYGTFGDYDDEIDGRARRHRGEQPAVDRVLPPGVRAVARAVRAASLAPVAAQLAQGRERAARLVADAADTAVRRRPAHPRDPGERPGVPAHRARRLRQRHHARHHARQHPGHRALLSLLHPLLVPRYAGLPAVYSGLDQLQSLLEKEHRPNGTWVPVSALPTSTRQAIDAACGAVLQSLAPIASITEPRNTANDF